VSNTKKKKNPTQKKPGKRQKTNSGVPHPPQTGHKPTGEIVGKQTFPKKNWEKKTRGKKLSATKNLVGNKGVEKRKKPNPPTHTPQKRPPGSKKTQRVFFPNQVKKGVGKKKGGTW